MLTRQSEFLMNETVFVIDNLTFDYFTGVNVENYVALLVRSANSGFSRLYDQR